MLDIGEALRPCQEAPHPCQEAPDMAMVIMVMSMPEEGTSISRPIVYKHINFYLHCNANIP